MLRTSPALPCITFFTRNVILTTLWSYNKRWIINVRCIRNNKWCMAKVGRLQTVLVGVNGAPRLSRSLGNSLQGDASNLTEAWNDVLALWGLIGTWPHVSLMAVSRLKLLLASSPITAFVVWHGRQGLSGGPSFHILQHLDERWDSQNRKSNWFEILEEQTDSALKTPRCGRTAIPDPTSGFLGWGLRVA